MEEALFYSPYLAPIQVPGKLGRGDLGILQFDQEVVHHKLTSRSTTIN